MSLLIEEDVALPLARTVRDLLSVELAVSPGGAPSVCMLVPGANVIADYCGAPWGCGMGFVRIDSVFPTNRFPQPSATPNSMRDLTAVRLQIGVLRCVPTLDEQAGPPTPEEQDEAVRVQMGDLAALKRVVECRAAWDDYLLGTYLPIGPNGDCAGGALTVTVRP